ncbi:MAG: hypothetical protein NTW68_03655 [candidate division NC10 bacterium]|nr:hypothetical protein [candidate division NC10 bacterium]
MGPASASGGHPTAAATAGRTRASGGGTVGTEGPGPALPAEGGDCLPPPETAEEAPVLQLGAAVLGAADGDEAAAVTARAAGTLRRQPEERRPG